MKRIFAHALSMLAVGGTLLVAACVLNNAAISQENCVGKSQISYIQTIDADDGAPLFLLTRGQNCAAPPLLWLHGGPGGAERPLFRLFNGSLEQDYVVTYFDQRGAGRSFDPGADPAKLTISRHLRDPDLVVDRLRAERHQDRIILVGHSWGGALALLYAHAHPEKVSAVVAVAPLVAGLDQERAQFEFVRAKALAAGDTDVLSDLAKIGPPPFPKTIGTRMEDLVDRYGGVFHQRPNYFMDTTEAVLKGYVSPFEISNTIRGNNVSLEAMHDELEQLDLRRSAPRFAVPVFMGNGMPKAKCGI